MEDLKYVLSGKLRQKVLTNLIIPNSPTRLAKKLNGDRSSVSRVLLYLQEKGLVRCINEDYKKGRIYTLTDKGKEIYNILRKM